MAGIFFDIGLIIILATVGGFLARLLKQPLISAYIFVGILIGPILGLVTDMGVVDVLSEIGIAFLLFIVGIELDLKRLKDVGAVASIGGLIQMVAVFLLGFFAFFILGFQSTESLYAGIILLFSSTMVVIKLLVDKSQLDTLHGRIIVGMLLMQDVVAVMILSVISHAANFSVIGLIWSLFLAIVVFGVAILFSKILFPQLFRYAAKTQELFFLLSLAVCFLFAIVFHEIGFSIAIGAFVAGLMLGNLPYNLEIISKVRSLRDFFATLFFVSIGIKLSFSAIAGFGAPFLALLFLTVILSPFLTFIIVMFFGFNRRVAFLAGVSLSQVSEFALIAVTEGVRVGHLGEGFLSLTIMVTLASIIVTAYLVKYEYKIYKFMLPFLRRFDRLRRKDRFIEHSFGEKPHDVVLIGYDRTGYTILHSLQKLNRDVVVVDFNPEIINQLIQEHVPCVYGDVGDEEVLEKLHLEKVELVISTVPTHQETLLLIKRVREINKSARLIVTAYNVEEALTLYKEGADYVIVPHLLGGAHAGMLLEEISNDIDKLITTKIEHIGELREHRRRHRRQLSKK